MREPLGDETIYQIEFADYRLLAKTPPRQVYHLGDQVGLRLNTRRVHLFDKISGKRLN